MRGHPVVMGMGERQGRSGGYGRFGPYGMWLLSVLSLGAGAGGLVWTAWNSCGAGMDKGDFQRVPHPRWHAHHHREHPGCANRSGVAHHEPAARAQMLRSNPPVEIPAWSTAQRAQIFTLLMRGNRALCSV